jgi:hypothetical protein
MLYLAGSGAKFIFVQLVNIPFFAQLKKPFVKRSKLVFKWFPLDANRDFS